MRKAIMMLGTLLITAIILISGSAVATWVYVLFNDELNTTDPLNIENEPDNKPASLGNVGPPVVLGWLLVNLSLDDVMPNSQDFTVFAACTENVHEESYKVYVGENTENLTYVGTGWDTTSEIFTTPSTGGNAWRYILLEAYISDTRNDPAPGADLDAVGWDK